MSKRHDDAGSDLSTVDDNELDQPAGEDESGAEKPKRKLDIDVQIKDVGPCKKHVAIEISRDEVSRQFDESLGSMTRDAQVPGFRPGHAPRSLIEKRFRKQVGDQVKSTLLVAALEQLDEDYKLNPITQPNLDIGAIKIPDEGPLRFEMEVEVQPEFALPTYKGLTVNRPVKTITDADVDNQMAAFLERHGQMVPKTEGVAEIGDYLTADLTFYREGQVTNAAKEIQFKLQNELRFQDGLVADVGAILTGIKPGETRQAEVSVGSGAPDPNLRGRTIQVAFQVNDLKQMRLPELNSQFLASLGFETRAELRQALRELLERRLKAQQKQAIRAEIMERMVRETPFDLPKDLVARQEKVTINRMVMQLRQEGLGPSEIRAREAELRTNAHESTLRGLKEFFILTQIAEAEGIEVEDQDFVDEIEAIAARSDESPRRVRAKIEKDGLTDAMASQILERKTLDRILELATYNEVPLVEQAEVETLDQTATTAPEPGPEGEAEAQAEAEAPEAAVAEGESQEGGSAG